MKTTKLYRPVNKAELDLLQDSEWKKILPRRPDQSIFYLVTRISKSNSDTNFLTEL